MTPHSRIVALIALILAAAAHAAPALLQSDSLVEIEGGNTALASQGNSFANMAAGMQSTEVPQEITDAEDVTDQAEQPPDEMVQEQEPAVEPPLESEVEPPLEPADEPPLEQVVEQEVVDAVEPQAEPPVKIDHQEVAKPVEQLTDVDPSKTVTVGPQVQDLLTVAAAPMLQETPLFETLEPQPAVTQQSQQQPQKAAAKPVEQAQAAPKPETLAPVPKPKPKPKPKPRGNSAQNAVQGTVAGQSPKPGGQASVQSGKAQAQGKAAASNYGGLVVRRIVRNKRTINIKGTGKVSFSIRPDGSLAGLRISRSSGSGKLDSFFLKTVRRAAPFPPPPPGARTNFGVELHGRK